MSCKRPRSSSMWSYFSIVDRNEKRAKCDMCGLVMSYKSTITNLKNHITKKHPTVNLITSSEDRDSSLPRSIPPTNSSNLGISPVSGPSGPSQATQVLGPHRLLEDSDDPPFPIPQQTTSCEREIASTPSTSDVLSKPTNIKQTTIGNYVTKKVTPGEKRKLDRSLLRLFTRDFQPFSVVGDSGFRQFVSQLNPSYVLPNRKTISTSFVPAAYEECQRVVKETLSTTCSVCLTTDCWSSSAQESYLAVTAHFVNDNFEFESVLLDCRMIEGSHTGEHLANEIRDITNQFGLSDKVQIVVSDNGSNIKAAVVNELKWRHFGCYAHTLNLIVQKALDHDKVAELLTKIKNIVKHFKRSNQDMEKLLKYQRDTGANNPKKLILDVVTRWNSTFYMLERFTELQESVRATLGNINKEIAALTIDEWKIATELCKVLKPFEQVTRKLSGEKYVSGSQVILLTTGLTDVCQKLLKKPFHQTALEVSQLLQVGVLDRFFNIENNKVIGTCSLLDPRFKLYPFTSESSKRLIKEHVKGLAIAEYNRQRSKQLNRAEEPEEIRPNEIEDPGEDADLSVTAYFDEVIKKIQPTGTATSNAIVELQRYLDEPTLDRKKDPMKWWAEHQHLYPVLSKIVQKNCNMVATSVPCERIFSKAGEVISDRRTRLKSSKVRQLLFLHANDTYWSIV